MTRSRRTLAALAALAILAGCDRGARRDLPNNSQDLDEGNALIVLMPDRFPNLAHKCVPESTTGVWTVTNDWMWIVYNDPECGGVGAITVLDNVPGANAASDGGDS